MCDVAIQKQNVLYIVITFTYIGTILEKLTFNNINSINKCLYD